MPEAVGPSGRPLRRESVAVGRGSFASIAGRIRLSRRSGPGPRPIVGRCSLGGRGFGGGSDARPGGGESGRRAANRCPRPSSKPRRAGSRDLLRPHALRSRSPTRLSVKKLMPPRPTATPAAVVAGTSGLLVQLETVVAACRQTRRPLSLLLVELSDTDDLLVKRGLEGVHGMRRSLESLCRNIDHRCAICQPYGDFGFAVILADCDRQMAVRLGNQLIQDVDRLSSQGSPDDRPIVGLSVGVATVALPAEELPGGRPDRRSRPLPLRFWRPPAVRWSRVLRFTNSAALLQIPPPREGEVRGFPIRYPYRR